VAWAGPLHPRRRRHVRAARVSMRVNARDAVWSMDATHLGRDGNGRAVQAEVVREVASTRTIGMTVGLQATDEEVVSLLDRVVVDRKGAPLVLLTDNGGAYISALLHRWCEALGVMHLLALPRTPQHNGASEHGMAELKEDAGLGKGVLVRSPAEAHAMLERSRARLDGNRLRRTRGWQTAVEADRRAPPWSLLATREEVLEEASCLLRRALIHCSGRRARRRAEREAILGALESFSMITRTRGGLLWTAHNAEGVS
jgi:hypothetical protein